MKSGVLVVGGSLVGLSVALATNRQGSHVTVLERSGGGTVSGGGVNGQQEFLVGGQHFSK
jgi:2-polyprenyl-6-methoxyphenol hydroxylase-like FAD-dependent oxidoreductase